MNQIWEQGMGNTFSAVTIFFKTPNCKLLEKNKDGLKINISLLLLNWKADL
jgi:hypothetical protein